MFNLSDSLGRPLFANIQISLVCCEQGFLKPALFASLLTIAAPARSGVPEDRRARKVRPDSNPRPTIPLCTILEILDSRAPTKIFKTIVVSVAVYVINFTLFGIGAVPMKCYLDNAMEQQTLGATNKHVRLTVAYDRCAFCPPARAFGICTLNSSHVRNAKGGVAKGRKPNFAGEIFLVLVVEGNVVSTCKNSTLCCLRNIGN